MKIVLSIMLVMIFIACNNEPKKETKDIEKKPTGIKHTIAPARSDLEKNKN